MVSSGLSYRHAVKRDQPSISSIAIFVAGIVVWQLSGAAIACLDVMQEVASYLTHDLQHRSLKVPRRGLAAHCTGDRDSQPADTAPAMLLRAAIFPLYIRSASLSSQWCRRPSDRLIRQNSKHL